jgi:hypothetical protein
MRAAAWTLTCPTLQENLLQTWAKRDKEDEWR